MKKIVYIVSSLRKAGPVNVLYEIISHLDRTQFQIYIIKLREDDPRRSITYKFEQMGVKIISLSSKLFYLEFFTKNVANKIRKIVGEIEPDMIHTHGYHPALLASYLPEWKRMETLHCICFEDFIFSRGKIIGRYMIMRYLAALQKLDHCAAISNAVKNAYLTSLDNTKLSVVYNGCDTQTFYPISASQIMSQRKNLGINSASRVYVVVASLSERKDPVTIIQAFKDLYCQNLLEKNTCVLFLGMGNLMEKCKKMAEGFPFIQFKGFQTNVAEYMQIADYSICASFSEGFGLNYIESLMVNVPVIGTDIPPFKEFTGLMPELCPLQFKAGDRDELKRAIILSQKIQIEKEKLGATAREIFSAQNMADQYSALYCSEL